MFIGLALMPALSYQFINPLLSRRKRDELNKGRKRKTDRLDRLAIAHCLRDGVAQPAFLAAPDSLEFQLWGKAYRRASRDRRRLTVELLSQLALAGGGGQLQGPAAATIHATHKANRLCRRLLFRQPPFNPNLSR